MQWPITISAAISKVDDPTTIATSDSFIRVAPMGKGARRIRKHAHR
jgi:hypothetical protein